LDCPDDWPSRKLKVLGIIRWALEHGYEYLWKIDDDVYLRPERLLSLEPFDFCGRIHSVDFVHDYGLYQPCTLKIAMGAIYGLSERSMRCLLEADVRPDFPQEDGWAMLQLETFGIKPVDLIKWVGFPNWHGTHPVPDRCNFPKFSPHPSNSVLASFEFIYPHQFRIIHSLFRGMGFFEAMETATKKGETT
jgi:hypothetical protein